MWQMQSQASFQPDKFSNMGPTRSPGLSKAAKRKLKDPNRPKRPTSGYFYFVADQRVLKQNKGEKITRVAEWTKEVSSYWRALSETDRKPYAAKAAIDKERYTTQMAAYKGKDLNKPKRPQSSYFLWLADYRIKMKGCGLDNKDLLRQAGVDWKKLTDAEKKPYEARAEVGKKDYERAIQQYNMTGGAAPKKARVEVEAKNGRDDQDDDDDEEDEDDDDEYEDDE